MTEGENKGSSWLLYPIFSEADPVVEGSRRCLPESFRDRTTIRKTEYLPCGLVLDTKFFFCYLFLTAG